MQIATWNVNSVKAHLEAILKWLKETAPDVVCLQEIKCEEHAFPTLAFDELGYNAAISGQKTYNGVAILSKHRIENVVRGLPGDSTDEQARYIEATIFGPVKPVIVCCLYLPNGNPVPGPKYDYKLAWMQRLKARAEKLLETEEPFILLGDYNIIPTNLDSKHPDRWTDDALNLLTSRQAYTELKNLGLTEAFRDLNPLTKGAYSYWDYQAGAWQKNNGIRIDHALLSPQAADRLISARFEPDVRGWEKTSDHVPLVIDIQ